jgi:hypothetical protein
MTILKSNSIFYALSYMLACNLLIWFGPKRLSASKMTVVQFIVL